jgi:outer membrane biosynthesis protein TonB
VKITIDIDTAEVSEEDLLVLNTLVSALGGPQSAPAAPVEAPAPKAEEKPKAKTPPPPPAPKAKAKAAEPEPTPEPEPADEEDDVVARAIALATELVSQKRTADIKSAMESVGATKVSDMTPEQAANFIAAIELL